MKTGENRILRRKRYLRGAVMVFLCLLSLLPFYLMFVNGSRTSDEIKAGVSFLFGSNLSANYEHFKSDQVGLGITIMGAMFNSFKIAVPYTLLSVYFSALTAYGFHAYNFKFKRLLWGFIMGVMMVPTQVFAIGYYRFMIQLGLIDTYVPLIITGISTPAVVFFMHQYLKGALPIEVVEAARIDGSGEFHTFNTIVLPMMKPALATQAIFQFVFSWNNLFLPTLILSSSGKKTLTMFVQMLTAESFRADYGVVFLSLAITILPMFVMYFILSRYIVAGVTIGGVKE